jgi:hypothetical protein
VALGGSPLVEELLSAVDRLTRAVDEVHDVTDRLADAALEVGIDSVQFENLLRGRS